MNRTDALTLPASAGLDRLCALVLKPWPVYENHSSHYPYFIFDFGKVWLFSQWDVSVRWHPSTNREQALDLLASRAEFRQYNIEFHRDMPPERRFCVSVREPFVVIFSDTLPLAIVRALLAAAPAEAWESLEKPG